MLRAKGDSLRVFKTFQFRYYLVAQCSLKCLSDSFYIINYNPMETPQWKHEVTIRPDSTLEGRTRVVIRAPRLIHKYRMWIEYFSDPLDWYIDDGIFVHDFQKPSNECLHQFPLYRFRFLPNRYTSVGIRPDAENEYQFTCPRKIYLSEGNQVIDFYFPALEDSIFDSYFINDNIIILTGDHIVWNGVEYLRVSPESLRN